MIDQKTIFSHTLQSRVHLVYISLSVGLLVLASSAFTLSGARPEALPTRSPSLPVKAIDASASMPASTPPPAPTASLPTLLIADHFDYPVAAPEDWVIQQDFSQSYNPVGGGWHVGEDWIIDPQLRDELGLRVSTINQSVQAVAAGWVRYADLVGYPCGVVILSHTLPDGESLYSMYAHIEALTVTPGQPVEDGQVLGQICPWPGNPKNSHLHFEIRSFYVKDYINGDNAACLFRHRNFPPGPGYWPICGSHWREKPADEGWVDPSDFILAHHAAAQSDLAELDASSIIKSVLQTTAPLP